MTRATIGICARSVSREAYSAVKIQQLQSGTERPRELRVRKVIWHYQHPLLGQHPSK